VTGSLAVLTASFAIPPLRTFLHLVLPSPLGWLLIGTGSLLAVLLSRVLASTKLVESAMARLPAPEPSAAQPAVVQV